MEKQKLIIFGTGTIPEIAAYYFENDSDYSVSGFVDKEEFVRGQTIHLGKPLMSWAQAIERYPAASIDMFVAIGYQKLIQFGR